MNHQFTGFAAGTWELRGVTVRGVVEYENGQQTWLYIARPNADMELLVRELRAMSPQKRQSGAHHCASVIPLGTWIRERTC